MMKECVTHRPLRVIRIDSWPLREPRQKSWKTRVAVKHGSGPHLCGLRQYFCAFRRTVIAAYDNVPEPKGALLARVFQEMTPFLKDGSPKLVK